MDQQRKAEISININEFKEILDPTIQIIQAKKRGYYYRSGFTVHSYFSFGDYINPEILPESPLLAIVDYVFNHFFIFERKCSSKKIQFKINIPKWILSLLFQKAN